MTWISGLTFVYFILRLSLIVHKAFPSVCFCNLYDVDPKLGPRKENTEHRLEVRKIYEQKVTKDSVKLSGTYYPVVSNIGSRTRLHTTSTPANTTLLRYCSMRVLSHCARRVHDAGKFRSHNTHFQEFFSFFGEKKEKKTVNTSPSCDLCWVVG